MAATHATRPIRSAAGRSPDWPALPARRVVYDQDTDPLSTDVRRAGRRNPLVRATDVGRAGRQDPLVRATDVGRASRQDPVRPAYDPVARWAAVGCLAVVTLILALVIFS